MKKYNPGRIIHPRVFYNEFLIPCCEYFFKNPEMEWIFYAAISNADIMAERLHYFWHYIAFKEPNNSGEIIEDAKSIMPDFLENNRSQGLKKYRHHLAAQNPDFQLVWDIHDAYKHYELGRSNANITYADQSGKIPSVLNETCNDLVIPIDDISAIWIRKKDGTLVSGKEVLTNVLAMWSTELARTGL